MGGDGAQSHFGPRGAFRMSAFGGELLGASSGSSGHGGCCMGGFGAQAHFGRRGVFRMSAFGG